MSYGDTTFMILATAMVCLMTPGLAFFYGGLTRKRSILIMMMQSFISMGIVTIIWIYGGFGLAFGRDIGGIIGNISDFFGLVKVGIEPSAVHAASIPFILFFCLSAHVLCDYRSPYDRSLCGTSEYEGVYELFSVMDYFSVYSGLPLGLGRRFFE